MDDVLGQPQIMGKGQGTNGNHDLYYLPIAAHWLSERYGNYLLW